MQIKLNDGTTLQVVQVFGGTRFYQNAQRDSLEFVFDFTHSMDALYETFSDKPNLRKITIISDDESENIYEDYVIVINMTRENVVLEPETSNTPEVTVPRIKVVMGQQTFTEKLLEQIINNSGN